LLFGLAPLAAAQTEALYSIEPPAGFQGEWGSSLFVLDDLDGDAVPDLAIGALVHGGGRIATVHSGADGSLLFDLVTPAMPMFVGMAMASVAPPAGTGAREIVVLGSPSSSASNGWIGVFSGMDGALL